jgi:outer membrane protein assembly factor BamB
MDRKSRPSNVQRWLILASAILAPACAGKAELAGHTSTSGASGGSAGGASGGDDVPAFGGAALAGFGGTGGEPPNIGPTLAFTPPAATSRESEVSNYALDAAHDNLQPGDRVASPLSKRWSALFPGQVSYPLVAKAAVFVFSDEDPFGNDARRTMNAVSIETGKTLWSRDLTDLSGSMAYDAGRLFIQNTFGRLSAYDAETGDNAWSVQLEGQGEYSAPVASGGRVYVNGTQLGGTTYAVDQATGKVLWTVDLDGSDGSVAIQGNLLLESAACNEVDAVDTMIGTLLWRHPGSCYGGGGITPSVYGNWIWSFDLDGSNLILDRDGHEHGSYPAGVPAFDGDNAFYATEGGLVSVDIASGVSKWMFSGDDKLCGGPVIAGAGQQVFIPSASGLVFELDEASGKQRSVVNVAGGTDNELGLINACNSGLSIAQGHLFVPVDDSLIEY